MTDDCELENSFNMPPHICPFCKVEHDHAHNTSANEAPSAGAVSICFDCTEIGVFNADGTVRKPTPEERKEMLADPRVQNIRAARMLQLADLL